ncbi:MAG: hypothetical protein AAFZ74_16170 [Pseudomonadota bacterium]
MPVKAETSDWVGPNVAWVKNRDVLSSFANAPVLEDGGGVGEGGGGGGDGGGGDGTTAWGDAGRLLSPPPPPPQPPIARRTARLAVVR